jgi:hypothetical protein
MSIAITAIVSAALWTTTADTRAATEAPELWAGHQVSFGTREIPFRGEVTTRMDTLVLGRVRREGDRLVIDQEACAVRFDEVAGVRVSMDAEGLPRSRVVFAQRDAAFLATSTIAWDDEDVDGDGHPGITIGVDAPVCSGDLYVSNHSRTRAEAAFDGDSFRGRASVNVKQSVLGARGRCLSAVARDTDEIVSGPFAYVRVPAGSTCASLVSSGWPIDAES